MDEIIDGRASADDSGTGRLTDWLADYTPHIALIHLGTNDVWAGQDTESTVSELETIIDILHADNANVTILLAKLIPIDNRSIQLGIDARNGEIDGIAIRKITAASPVLFVDQSLGFDPVTDTYDGVHPNTSGRQKMATR